MRRRYYATFVSGFQRTVKDILETTVRDVVIVRLLDGAVVFETAVPFDSLRLFCFNNMFLVLHILEQKKNHDVIETHMKFVGKDRKIRLSAIQKTETIRTFRIVTSNANRLVSVNEDLKRRLERVICKEMNLTPNRSKPDAEFWFLYRNEGFSFFLHRLSKHAPFDKTLRKGELLPQIAYMMCWLSEPQRSDIVVDPFCGYGSILRQRVHVPFERFYAFDIKKEAVAITKALAKTTIKEKPLKKCEIRTFDFFGMPQSFKQESVDKIITDPPWGIYEPLPLPVDQFFDDMVRICRTVLKPGGLLVVLAARKEEFALSVSRIREFTIVETADILVSGKKACVYKVKKTTPLPATTRR
jgi:tRNA G10  N-methylase Trm11